MLVQPREKLPLKRVYMHEFPLTSYLDMEKGINVINQFLVFSPFSLDLQEDMFIVNENSLREFNSGYQ